MQKFKGVIVILAGTEYEVPPLNFNQLEQFKDVIAGKDITNTDADDPFASLRRRLPMCHAAISRNYPEMTLQQLQDVVDLNNVHELIEAVMNMNGLKERAAKRAADAGEAVPVPATN